MASFPQPFPTSNPSIAAAAEASSAGAQAYSGLMAALSQHAARMQQQKAQGIAQAQRETEDRVRAFNEGWVPAEDRIQTYGSDGQKSFVLRPPSTPNQDQSRNVRIGGQWMHKPTPAEADAAKLNDTNSFPLNDALRKTAAMFDIDLPATGRAPFALLENLNRAAELHKSAHPQPKTGPFQLKGESGDVKDANGKPLLMTFDEANGTLSPVDLGNGRQSPPPAPSGPPRGDSPFSMMDYLLRTGAGAGATGAPSPAASAGAIPSAFTFDPTKPKPEPQPHIQMSTDKKGNVTEWATHPVTGQVLWTHNYPGRGLEHRDPDAEPRQKPASATQLRLIETRKSTNLQKATAQYRRDLSEAITNDDKLAALKALRQSQQDAQNEYEQTLSDVLGKPVDHNSWADSAGASDQPKPVAANQPQPAGRGGRPAQTTTAPGSQTLATRKVATLEDVRDFAKKKGVSEAQAIRAAQQQGYRIGGR